MSRVFGRVRLFHRLRAVEGIDLYALVENSLDGGYAGRWSIEISGSEDLRREADVGHGRCIAMAELACLALVGEMSFERFERLQCPVLQPAVARSFVQMHFSFEIAADTRHDERMGVARDNHREPANAGAAAWVLGQQRRCRGGLFQVLDDGERLKERRAAVDHERWNHALRIDRLVVVAMLHALQQVDVLLLRLYSLERQRHAYAVGGERAPESV